MDKNAESAARPAAQLEQQAQIKRHQPLYLKHRPQSLAELVGQAAVTRTLTNAITYDRLSHAYLFTGPRGTGKTSTARILAKSLNCKSSEKATTQPCQTCASCIEIREGISPAVLEIDAASNNSVEDARVLIERAPLVAPGGRYKIYIIDECHMLTKEAFNALLKTIEDPPPNVVFVLATTEEHKVLPTIVSRCQRLMFRLVTQDDLLQHLRDVATREEINITPAALDFLARRSGGGLRDALGLLDQASLLSTPEHAVDVQDLLGLLGALNEDVLLKLSDHILNRRGGELLACAAALLGEGREPAMIVQEMAKHFLNLAKASYLNGESMKADQEPLFLGSAQYADGVCQQAPLFERSELTQIVEALDRLEQACRRSTQPVMHLEVGLLALCHRHDMLLIRELSERVDKLERALAGEIQITAPHAVHAAAPPAASSPTAHAAAQAKAPPSAVHAAAAPPASAPAAEAPESPATAEEADTSFTEAAHPAAVASIALAAPVAPAATTAVASAVSAPAAAAPAAEESEGASVSPDELDRVWTSLLEELQRRHIPTYSLANMHAIPLSLTDRELVVGTKETLIKTLEMKSEHIKAACAAVAGKTIMLKIRPVNLDAAVRSAPARPREPGKVAAGKAEASQADSQPDADNDDSEHASDAPPPEPVTQAQPAQPLTAAPSRQPAAPAGSSGIIKEAYRLFEGPGSRQIGDKK